MTQTGTITDYVLHICNMVRTRKGDLFAPCNRLSGNTNWQNNYEFDLMKRVFRAMRQLKLIVNHSTMKTPDLDEASPDIIDKILAEVKTVTPMLPMPDGTVALQTYLLQVERYQPILEAIRRKTQELVQKDDDGED